MGSVEDLIAEGKEAFRRGDGAASRRAFEAALAIREDAESLEGLGRALYLEVDYPASMEAHERAYRAYSLEGNLLGAARAARALFWIHANLYGDWAVAQGWLARARSLLEDAGAGTSESGWVRVLAAISEPDPLRRQEEFRTAAEMGRRAGDADLCFEATGWIGLELVLAGRPAEGMAFLDEALAAVCAGEVSDLYVTEGVFCGMFQACEVARDVTRAEQWLRAADDLVRRRRLVAVGGFCRAHYGGILTEAGRWPEAEEQLSEAARIFERSYVGVRANVLARLADLRVRQGRLEEAAVLLRGIDQHPDAARPLAALRLARGELVLARDGLERALADPGLFPPASVPLLTLLVDVHLASGDVDDAAATADHLAEMAAAHPTFYLRACAALARGRVCVASGTGDARACLLEALSAFSRAQMPAELARARLELARAVAAEQPEVAVAEATAALEAFEQLPAARDADAAAALLRTLGGPARTGPRSGEGLTKREGQVLELLGHGLSNAEIGDRLYISAKTVEHHVGRLLAKLGLRNRAEAAAYAVRRPS